MKSLLKNRSYNVSKDNISQSENIFKYLLTKKKSSFIQCISLDRLNLVDTFCACERSVRLCHYVREKAYLYANMYVVAAQISLESEKWNDSISMLYKLYFCSIKNN